MKAAVLLGAVVLAASITSPAVANAASVNCTKNLWHTVGNITCTSTGGRYTFSDVYADCDNQSDIHRRQWVIDGSSTQRFECRHKINNIHTVI
ncbi:hypothetical protein ACFFQW_11780 [Umezawaea endophytica]|uniref:Uncharacterized protein n=1 Tax=Umezawaea endophytica TaxID=1654476 RepID=A0A9X2VTI8_9PSEU|nr:hypothetical protein [Umezawaea endophytica]MCS7482480.1 hypothetical protein [Umezawaea endophytica]